MPTQGQSAALSLIFDGPVAIGAYTVLESGPGFTGLLAGAGVALLVSATTPQPYVGKTAALAI